MSCRCELISTLMKVPNNYGGRVGVMLKQFMSIFARKQKIQPFEADKMRMGSNKNLVELKQTHPVTRAPLRQRTLSDEQTSRI